jgi:hypothetical protein
MAMATAMMSTLLMMLEWNMVAIVISQSSGSVQFWHRSANIILLSGLVLSHVYSICYGMYILPTYLNYCHY